MGETLNEVRVGGPITLWKFVELGNPRGKVTYHSVSNCSTLWGMGGPAMEVCVEVGTFGTELICGECGWSRQLFDLWRVWERRPMLGGVSDRLLLTNNRSLVHSSHPDPSWVLLNQLLAPFVVARLDGQYGWEERVVCVSAELALWVADTFDPAYAYFAGRVADGDRGDVYELALGLWQQPSDPWAPAVETLEDPAEALELARRLGGAGNGTTRVGAES